MTKLLLALFLALPLSVRAQWTQTGGIQGGYFGAVVSAGSNLVAATTNGTIFRYDGNSWKGNHGTDKVTSLYRSGNALIGFNYSVMLVSVDSGNTWSNRTVPLTAGIEPLVTDEAIYILNSNGDSLFSSTDLGLSWFHVPMNMTYTDSGQQRSILMLMNLFISGSTIHAAAMTDDPTHMLLLLESSNAGQSWNVSFRPEPGDLIADIVSTGNTTIFTTFSGVYRKTGGSSWTAANTGLPNVNGSVSAGKLKVVNSTIYALVNNESNSLFRFEENGGLWVSMNSPALAADIDIYKGNPVIASVKGVSRRIDGHWFKLTDDVIATTSLPVAFSENVVFSAHGYTTYRSVNGGESWDSIAGSMTQLKFKGTDLLSTTQSGIVRSTDMGNTWTLINNGIPQSYIQKASDVAVSGNVLYAGFNGTRRRDHLPAVWEQGGIYRSTDNGASWTTLNAGLAHEGGVPAPVYAIHASPSRVLLRTIEGTYTLNGNSWLKISNSFPVNTYYSSVIVSGDSIMLGSNHGMMVSADNGSTWRMLKHGLPDAGFGLYYMHYFRYLEQYFAYDYLNREMYRLSDTTWQVSDLNLPEGLHGMGFSSAGNVLYAGTIDRGIWKYNKSQTGVEESAMNPDELKLEQNYPNPFNPSTVIRFTLPVTGNVSLKVYNPAGEMVAELVNGEMQAGSHSVTFNAASLNSGVYFYSLTAGGKKKSGKMILLK